jgi:cell volume regulation protein A
MELTLLSISLVILGAVFSTRISHKFGIPTLVLFVGIGLLAGSSGPGGVEFSDHRLSYEIGLLALAAILFSGGLDTRATHFYAALVPASMLATLGVLLTVLITALLVFALTPFSFLEGLLLGAVLAPTDAAAVFSALRGRGLQQRLRAILETESGTNDPVGIYLTLALTTVISSGRTDVTSLISGMVVQLVIGGFLGYVFGNLLAWLINHIRLDAFGLYPVFALAGGLLCYASTTLLDGNGFLAVYVAGVIIGNAPLVHKQSITGFMDELAWGAQITMFTLLGLLAFPDRWFGVLPYALIVAFLVLFIARPAAVCLTLYPLRFTGEAYRFTAKEQVLLSWAGLKGAVPIILALVPLINQVPIAETLFNIVFVVVVVGTTLQGMTIGPLATWLKLAEPELPNPPLRIELGGATPPNSAIFDVFLTSKSAVVGKSLVSLALPSNVAVTAIYRNKDLIAPRGDTVFEKGDHVFILSSDATNNSLTRIFTDHSYDDR